MVQDDDVHAPLSERSDGSDGGRAAIHRQEQAGGELCEAIFHGFLGEAVAFIEAMGQVVVDLPTERAQHFEQQDGGGDTVHIVIAEDDEVFAALAGLEEAFDRGAHIWQQERIGQLLEAGLEKGSDGGWVTQAAVKQALGEQRRDAQGVGQLAGEPGLRRVE